MLFKRWWYMNNSNGEVNKYLRVADLRGTGADGGDCGGDGTGDDIGDS